MTPSHNRDLFYIRDSHRPVIPVLKGALDVFKTFSTLCFLTVPSHTLVIHWLFQKEYLIGFSRPANLAHGGHMDFCY